MKFLEKVALILFSNIILILSIIMCLLIFGWLDLDFTTMIFRQILITPTATNILLAVSILFILLAIKCIFFGSDSKEKDDLKDGLLLENDKGRLLVSKDTIQNLTNGVVKGFEGAENISSKVVLDTENNLRVYVTLSIKPDAVIKDLSVNLQNKIKETIKRSMDLDVKEVNIKIKDVATAKKDNPVE